MTDKRKIDVTTNIDTFVYDAPPKKTTVRLRKIDPKQLKRILLEHKVPVTGSRVLISSLFGIHSTNKVIYSKQEKKQKIINKLIDELLDELNLE